MQTLAALRSQIDALDADLLRLVDARAGLGAAIAEAKARENGARENGAREGGADAQTSQLRPDREAMLIRKLLAMPRQSASDAVVVRVWRELISENLRIQGAAHGGLHLNLSSQEHSREVLVWARERFGFAPSFGYVDNAAAAVQAARDPRHISVLSLDPRGGAWWARLLAEPKVRVMAALPELSAGRFHAVAVAAIAPWPLKLTGAIYGAVAVVATAWFALLAVRVAARTAGEGDTMRPEKQLFGFSIVYLFVLFGAVVVDRWLA